jgi:hypothetical protein
MVRVNANTGAVIAVNNIPAAIAISSDGNLIATVSETGVVRRYDGPTGRFLGVFSAGNNALGIQVSGGVIAVTSATTIRRYDSNGRFLGARSL